MGEKTFSNIGGVLFTDTGEAICDIKDIQEFEPVTNDPGIDDTTEYSNALNEEMLVISCDISPIYKKRLNRVVYNWHCSGPVRKQALWKELIKKYTWRG